MRVTLTEIAELADHVVGTFNPSFCFGRARLGAALQPFDFPPHPAGKGSFPADLGGKKFRALHQKLTVRTVMTQKPVGIRAPQFDRAIGDGFEKSPIVADRQRGK